MNMKKIVSAALALGLTVSGAAFAEMTDLESANARIAELEALVEMYKPFYDSQVVASFDGGIIMRDHAMARYEMYESMFSQYGISLADYGYDTAYKQSAVDELVEEAIIAAKASELGLDVLDEETEAALQTEAESSYESYVESVLEYFSGDGVTEEEARAQAEAYLESYDYTVESIASDLKTNLINTAVYDYATAGVEVTDEALEAYYQQAVTEQTDTYSNTTEYISAYNDGTTTIVWNPEGMRAVKQVLIKFSDDQQTSYDELTTTLETLNAELTSVQEGTAEGEVRAESDITADIAAVEADIDALYTELETVANEVVEKFNNGTPIAELIEQYNGDPGMQSEPNATIGYAVCADNGMYDPAFTEAAMSIESVGGLSAPARGMYGLYIVYYDTEIPAGEVGLDSVRDALTESATEELKSQAYADAVTSWIEAANVTYFYENM